MPFPQPNEYNEAIQNLRSTISDTELRQGEAAVNPLGLPMPSSGNFADVYKVHCPATGNTWAVKCFTREVAGLKERYRGISEHLRKVPFGFMVEFHYIEPGIRIGKQSYPFLKMRWVEGLRLNQFVCDYLDKPKTLKNLLPLWVKLSAKLREAKIAHGDLQHGNVLLVPVPETGQLSLKLIDYDGMYVPALAKRKSGEVGHPCFQHPQRIKEAVYNADVDRFSHLAIYTAIQAAIVGKRELWDKFDNGDNLLFRESDFKNPETSELFRRLWETPSQPELHALTGRLILACKRPLNQCPHLDELVFNGAVLPLSPELEAKVGAMVGAAGPAAQAPPQFSSSAAGTFAVPQAPAAAAAASTYPLAPLGDLLADMPAPLPAARTSPLAPRKRSRLKKMGVLPWVAGGAAALGLVVLVGVLAYVIGSAGHDAPSSGPAIALAPPTSSPGVSASTASASLPSPPAQTAAISPSGQSNPSPPVPPPPSGPAVPPPPSDPDVAPSSPPGPDHVPGSKSDLGARAEPATPGSLPATAPPPGASAPSPVNPTLPGNAALFSVVGRNLSCRGSHEECRVTLNFIYSGPLGTSYNLVIVGRNGVRNASPFVVNSTPASCTATFAGVGTEDGPFNVSIEDASGRRVDLAMRMPAVPPFRQPPAVPPFRQPMVRVNPRLGVPRIPFAPPANQPGTPAVQAIPAVAQQPGHRTRLVGNVSGLPADSNFDPLGFISVHHREDGSGGSPADSSGDGSPVLGFSYQFGQWAGKPALKDLVPIYDEERQSDRPTAPRPARTLHGRIVVNPGVQEVVARKGYAVGALEVKTNPYVAAVRVVFMRLGDDGRLDTEDTYKSAWIGQAAGSAQTIGGDGKKVIGVCGRRALVLDAVGLVLE